MSQEKQFYWIPMKAVCPTCSKDVIGEAGAEIEPSKLGELTASVALTPLFCQSCQLPVPNTVPRATFPQVVSEEKFRSRKLYEKSSVQVTKVPEQIN